MTYITDGRRFSLDYGNLKYEHEKFCRMTDKEFKENVIHAAHLACIISYLKALGEEATIADRGIVHQLIHVAALDDATINLNEIRKQFEYLLKLA
jgi:hypothetical protein